MKFHNGISRYNTLKIIYRFINFGTVLNFMPYKKPYLIFRSYLPKNVIKKNNNKQCFYVFLLRIYTTMLGKKTSVNVLKDDLRKKVIVCFQKMMLFSHVMSVFIVTNLYEINIQNHIFAEQFVVF